MLTKKPEILSVFFAIGYLLLCVIAKANMVWLIKAGTVMVVTIVKVTDVSSRYIPITVTIIGAHHTSLFFFYLIV